MELEEQIRLHKAISKRMEELEEKKRELSQSIMAAMTDKTLQVNGYLVKRFSRLSISLTPEQARPFGAVKMEEVVDKEKLKALYKSGEPIPGVKEISFIHVLIT
jgi:hypothetical protein